MRFSLSALLLLLSLAPIQSAEPWQTYRANAQRTGNLDNQPGPTTPKVLWVLKSQEHFVATPVLSADRVYLAGLGAFNVANFGAFPLIPKGPPAPIWSKSTPYLKLPTVSSPVLADDHLFFGDGMHQTSGAYLHCLQAESGLPIWQLPVPGELVHLEGSPTIRGKQMFIGGGAAGVIAIQWDKATLDGQELDLVTIAKKQADKFKELQAKFEIDKKKDPDFAVPPSEDGLHKPAPKTLWTAGKERWHVDAPINVVGDDVFVGSSFLDKEKLGERALFCLNADDGKVRWTAPLKFNPWGGASVSGDTVIVGGSSIGYYVNELKGAKGDLVALDRKTGKERWRKEVPGGVVSSAAIADGLAVITATDGKVRAFSIADGERRWLTDVKMPMFAPPAVAGGVVYVGDLRGVITAIDLKTGAIRWTLDLGKDPAVMSPGMVYGGVVVQGGRLYVATCNLEGPFVRKPTVLVCIGNP